MKIEDYISHVFEEANRESEHQHVTQHTEAHYLEHPGELRMELWCFYYRNVFKSETLSRMSAFFDFHLGRHTGIPADFVYFVKRSPREIPSDAVAFISNTRFREELALVLDNWLEKADGLAERKRLVDYNNDHRISGVLSQDITRAYFMGVFTAKARKGKSRGKQIMSADDVELFLGANLAGFPYRELKEKIQTNANQLYIKRAVYLFYQEHRHSAHEASQYCRMIIDTFDDFRHYATPRSLLSSWAETPDKLTERFLGNFLGSLLGK